MHIYIVNFNTKEKRIHKSKECCRLATCHDNIPHVVAVSYVFEDDLFFFGTDFNTRKYRNLIKKWLNCSSCRFLFIVL